MEKNGKQHSQTSVWYTMRTKDVVYKATESSTTSEPCPSVLHQRNLARVLPIFFGLLLLPAFHDKLSLNS